MRIYEPTLTPDPDRAAAFDRALQLFYRGEFAAAGAAFAALSGDETALAYIEKCRALLAHPPSQWQGVWEMTEK